MGRDTKQIHQPDQPQPGQYDVVLGGQTPPPVGGVVLGGLEGVRWRLRSQQVEERLGAIAQLSAHGLSAYGAAGLDLLISALQDPSLLVQKTAYVHLRHRREPEVRQALRQYDPYPLVEYLYSLHGHRSGVTAIALSPDSKIAISGGRDATLRIWDLPSRDEVMVIPAWGFVYAIAISPNNRTFTVRGRHQTLSVWDMRTGQQLDPIETEGPTRTIASVTVSPDRQRTQRHLISGSQNTIKIWNLQIGREVNRLQGHTSLVTAVAIAPRQPLLVSGSEDKTIRVWGIKD